MSGWRQNLGRDRIVSIQTSSRGRARNSNIFARAPPWGSVRCFRNSLEPDGNGGFQRPEWCFQNYFSHEDAADPQKWRLLLRGVVLDDHHKCLGEKNMHPRCGNAQNYNINKEWPCMQMWTSISTSRLTWYNSSRNGKRDERSKSNEKIQCLKVLMLSSTKREHTGPSEWKCNRDLFRKLGPQIQVAR